MYFNKFPLLAYLDGFDGKKKAKLVTDVLKRVFIRSSVREESSFFIDYDLQEGDTPENISHRLYDTSGFFWVVILVNEALNPYYDFSLDSSSLERYAKKKYFGKYFYLVDTADDTKLSGLTFAQDETIFSSTNALDDFNVRKENFNIRARIVDHEPSLGRVRVDGGEHTYFTEGNLIGVERGSEIKQAKIKRIEDGLYALHHFGPGTTGSYNPLAASDGTPLGITGATGDYTLVAPELYQTRLGTYLGLSGSRVTDNVITNFENTINENEAKRAIKLIHPDFIREVATAFESLMQE